MPSSDRQAHALDDLCSFGRCWTQGTSSQHRETARPIDLAQTLRFVVGVHHALHILSCPVWSCVPVELVILTRFSCVVVFSTRHVQRRRVMATPKPGRAMLAPPAPKRSATARSPNNAQFWLRCASMLLVSRTTPGGNASDSFILSRGTSIVPVAALSGAYCFMHHIACNPGTSANKHSLEPLHLFLRTPLRLKTTQNLMLI
jgi:hypothetical protein